MTVNFHAHAFPDALAPRAIAALVKGSGGLYPAHGDGTVNGLVKQMDKYGIDLSVIQPVVTKLSQVKTVNEWAAAQRSDRIVPFGGIFPHTDDYKRDIDFVCSLGLPGIKLHAEYQQFTVDAPEMLRLYDYAFSKGLIVLHHAGFDPAYPPPYHTSPAQFAHIAHEMRGGVLVVAHLGGQMQWDEVERDLAGENVYLDTSMGFHYYSDEQFLRIAAKHGTDRLLFATDHPWSDAAEELARLKALPLTAAQKQAILGGNAARLLHLT